MATHSAHELLVGRHFVVVELDGAAVLPGAPPTLDFDAEGRVHGRAGVNRVSGPYSVDGSTLSCGALATTLMAGPSEAMEQERRLLQVLGGPLDVTPAHDDAQVGLATGGATVLVLRARDDAETL